MSRRRLDFVSKSVWVPDKDEAFVLARVIDIEVDGVNVEIGKKSKNYAYEDVYPAEVESSTDMDDNCALMFLNPATVLHNIRRRYKKDTIYTYVANILIAINPYKNIPGLYDVECMKRYNGKSIGALAPHVFAIGDKAYREMKNMKLNQSIIVSGESGSGKTESVKHILRYLTESYGKQYGIIEERIIDSNPLLEAFGNAKTTRNNNSSRFGKFIELHFSKEISILGGYISHYLLERTRICSQSSGERNYHIFYQLCCAAPEDIRSKLRITNPDDFNILKQGCSSYFLDEKTNTQVVSERKSRSHQQSGPLYDIQLDDYRGYHDAMTALKNIGLDEAKRLDVLSVVASVMHLGNLQFEPDLSNTDGGCKPMESPKSSDALSASSQLLGISPAQLEKCLTNRTMRPKTMGGRRSSLILVPLKIEDAVYTRDALCKSIYVRLFDYLVKSVNSSFPPTNSSSFYIGILDIAGFEYFPENSFEQFCINYCNERLQQFFNQRILRDEQDLYEREGLGVRHIEYVDNQDCIDLIEGRSVGILDLLDEESKLPQPASTHFTLEVISKNKKHQRLDLARKSHLKLYKMLRDDEGFMIRHFAGAVVYSTNKFIEKNNDAMHASLVNMISEESTSDIIKTLFGEHSEQAAAEGKLNFVSVGSKFRTQLTDLMERLDTTGTSFVRCIKPNERMKPAIFDAPHILTQLQCAGMLSVIELMQQGFPSRAKFQVLYSLYKKYLPEDLVQLEPRFFLKGLFNCVNMSASDYKFGLTRVFFRPGKFSEFDMLMREDPENLKNLISQVRKWLRKARWRKAQYFILSAIKLRNQMENRRQKLITLQNVLRAMNQIKQHRFRIAALTQIKYLDERLKHMIDSGLMQSESLKTKARQLNERCDGLQSYIWKTREDKSVDEKSLEVQVKELSTRLDELVSEAKKESALEKKQAEEERLRTIQLELQKQKEEEMLRKQKEELATEETKRRRALDERRVVEEQKLKERMKDAVEKKVEMMKKEKEQIARKRQLEQMKLDHHLAERIAATTGGEVDPMTIIGLPKLVEVPKTSKFDLSSWRYAQLRDTINTSCDIELLEACREEFHRRLKAYHQWKAKNKARGTPVDRRIPPEISEAIESMRAVIGKDTVVDNEQRFFKVPITTAHTPLGSSSASGINGSSSNEADSALRSPLTTGRVWYAHFDGRWICRQIEIGDQTKPPRPLIAGIDDLDMCELRLDETDLTSRENVEILESDFEKVWNSYGGLQYMAEHYSQISSKYLQDKAKTLVTLADL